MRKNYLYNVLLTLTNILFPIFSFPYASRILGPIGIGKVQLSLSWAQYMGLIAALGIPIYGLQEIARVKNDKPVLNKVFSELFCIYTLMSICVFIIYCFLIYFIPFFKVNSLLYYISGVFVLLNFTTLDWVYAGLEQYRIIAIRSVIIKMLGLIFLYLFVHSKEDIVIYILINLFSMLGNNIISVVYLSKHATFQSENLEFKKHLMPIGYIFGTTIAASIYTHLDTILLGIFSNEQAVGLYTAASKMAKLSIPFITAAGFVMIPQFAMATKMENREKLQQLLDRSWQFIVFFAVPISFGLFVYAPEFISLFSGKNFQEANITMKILSLLPFLIGLGYFFAFLILVPTGNNKEMFIAVLIGMILSVFLSILLIPKWKENGSAISSIITEIIVTLLYYYFIQKKLSNYKLQFNWSVIIKAILSCVLFIPISFIIRKTNQVDAIVLGLGILVSAIIYFITQFFVFKNNLSFLRKHD